jgi:membrane protease YdiL (CAAX protease family)
MDKRVWSFLALAFGFTWGVAGIGILGFGLNAASGTGYAVMAALCMLGPAVAALVQQHLLDRAPWSGLGLPVRGTRWVFVGLTALLGIAIVPGALLSTHLLGSFTAVDGFGDVAFTTDRMLAMFNDISLQARGEPMDAAQLAKLEGIPPGLVLILALLGAVVAAVTVNLPFMLGEELGWRGYLFQRLASWSPLRRVAFTGAVWGLWHAPLILAGHNYPGHPLQGVGMMVLFCGVLALLFDWTRVRTGSVWSSCLLHGIINGSAGAFSIYTLGGHPLLGSPAGVAGIVAIALLGAAVLLVDRPYRTGGVTTNVQP